jgi:hypothetical protein
MESSEKLHSKTQDEVNDSANVSDETLENIAELTIESENIENEPVAEDVAPEIIETIEEPTADVEEETVESVSTEKIVTANEEPETVTEPEISSEPETVIEEVVETETAVEEVEEAITEETEEEVSAEKMVDEEIPEVIEMVAEEVVVEAEPQVAAVEEEKEELITSFEEVIQQANLVDEELASELIANEEVAISSNIPDYSNHSEVELINELRTLLEGPGFFEIIDQVESIKSNFYKKLKAKLVEEKKKFIEEGGFEEEFKPEVDPYEHDLKTLLQQFKQRKAEHNKDIEAEKDDNLKKKYEIIEDIKTLVNRKESINKTFQDFRDLQQKWREIGLVPQANMKDLWENYHHHVENFYDYIKINKELRDLDLKRNMEEKISLCEKAEALVLEPSIIKSFNALQKFHDLWREIGPVPRDKKEELWERFKAATTLINKKHQDFFENRKRSQKKNLDAKTALCEKVEEILDKEPATHKEWEDKSKDLVELQKYWRTIGFAPQKENTMIYERFRQACDTFFDKKREFYSKHKEVQSNNLQMKIDLCVQAEALKESTDWKKATEEFISIQKKWKEIGPVPRKQSDIIWKRFRSACDHFFKHKSEFFNSKDSEQVDNLKKKNELIDAVVNFESTGDDEKDFEMLRDCQRSWTEIGHVPIQQKDDVQKRFRDAINIQFDKLRVGDKDRNIMKFKNKMSDMKTTNRGQNKMFFERDKYITKLRQLESDLVTLKNNIGFFANSKNAEALIQDVERKIAHNEEQIVYLKEKIKVIDNMDDNQ